MEGEAPPLSQGTWVGSLKQETSVYPLGIPRESTAFVAASGPPLNIATWRVTVPPSRTEVGSTPNTATCRSALETGFLIPVPLSMTLGWFTGLKAWSVTEMLSVELCGPVTDGANTT